MRKGAVLACLLALACQPALGQEPGPAPEDLKRSGAEVFSRIAQSLDPASCTPSAAQSKWMKQYIHNPSRFEQQLIDMLPVLDHVSYQTRKQDLPMEFALIPFVESRFQPRAVAKGGPTGLWQMMPNTARHFGLRIGGRQDGRYSVFASTDAALEYLGDLQKMFGHWQTSIMAYNAGDSRMRGSLKRQGLRQADADRGLPTGLAPHTYAYVKKIQALSCFFLDSRRFGVDLPNYVEFKAMPSDVDLPVLNNGN